MFIKIKGLVQVDEKAQVLFVDFDCKEFIYKVLINCYNLSVKL